MTYNQALLVLIDGAFLAAGAHEGPSDMTTDEYTNLVYQAAQRVAGELNLDVEGLLDLLEKEASWRA